ncbi:MAG: ribulose-phosphate 3-epimerase, partial [Oscillospiraceae bacterium]|nr:ribulose-phosphate 3-epimerase [Oscillospiraceae bacterium]
LAALKRIRELGVRPAISVKPKTPAEAVLPFLEICSLILVMTVEPGFGGQSFMADMMPKLKTIRGWIDGGNPRCELEVDGGVNAQTGKICVENGANVLVTGSAWFKNPDPAAFCRALKS